MAGETIYSYMYILNSTARTSIGIYLICLTTYFCEKSSQNGGLEENKLACKARQAFFAFFFLSIRMVFLSVNIYFKIAY